MSQHSKESNLTVSIPGTNASQSCEPDGQWDFTASFTLFIIIAGTIANLFVLWMFYLRPLLRTPFCVYLINLLLGSLVMSLVLEPMNLLNQYYSSWKLGYEACVFRNYIGWTISDVIIFSHFLIALNRLWAVTFPVSYRSHHKRGVAVCICVSTWVAINIYIIPTILTITRLYGPDASGKYRCGLNTDPIGAWGSVLQLVFYDLPIILVFLFYPVICYKSFFDTRKARRVRASNSILVERSRQYASRATSNLHEPTNAVSAARNPARKDTCCGHSRHGSRSGFTTLTLMTLSVLICLAPNEVYFTILMVVDFDPPGLFAAVRIVQSLTTVLDPLLIVLANRDLRAFVRRASFVGLVKLTCWQQNMVRPISS